MIRGLSDGRRNYPATLFSLVLHLENVKARSMDPNGWE